MKPGEAIHFAGDLDTQASPVRVVRAFMVVGLLASSLFMLLIVAVPPPVGSSPVPLLACGVLACFHAMLALWPGALSLVRTMHCYVLVVGVAAAVVAAASGLGLALVALGIVPVMLCAAATLFTRALTLSIALTQALLLCALAVAQSQGLIGAAVAAADLLWLLVGHLVLLLAASTVGLLLRGVIGHTVARQRLREQRFVGLLAGPLIGIGKPTPSCASRTCPNTLRAARA